MRATCCGARAAKQAFACRLLNAHPAFAGISVLWAVERTSAVTQPSYVRAAPIACNSAVLSFSGPPHAPYDALMMRVPRQLG